MSYQVWLESLGCPKNQVDSDKILAHLRRKGASEARSLEEADLIVVNTCAFIEAAREESVETILSLASMKAKNAKLVVTGCLAERYGKELAGEVPEVDLVAPFELDFSSIMGKPEWETPSLGSTQIAIRTGFRSKKEVGFPEMDLLNLPRAKSSAPWAYLKVAEGCDRKCGFCAIPSFRGKQRSRGLESIVLEAGELGAQEIVLVAQDLASYGKDLYGSKSLEKLLVGLSGISEWIRLLYIYPSELTESLIEAIFAYCVPYFDLSLQHVSADHLRRMRRYGSYERIMKKITSIRSRDPQVTLRSSFILGYPGETTADHEELKNFVLEAELDWIGLFTFSEEDGTYAASLGEKVERGLALERLNEISEIQDAITRARRTSQVGRELKVLVDDVGVGRSYMEAPEIDGVISLSPLLAPGTFHKVRIVEAIGPDLVGENARFDLG